MKTITNVSKISRVAKVTTFRLLLIIAGCMFMYLTFNYTMPNPELQTAFIRYSVKLSTLTLSFVAFVVAFVTPAKVIANH